MLRLTLLALTLILTAASPPSFAKDFGELSRAASSFAEATEDKTEGRQDQRKKKVLIIGIDGCRPDCLMKAKTPHLDSLMRSGAWSLKAQTGEITSSGPSWSNMLTGVWRKKHNVRNNSFKGGKLKEYPHFFVRLKEWSG